jgi:hypothetical protein
MDTDSPNICVLSIYVIKYIFAGAVGYVSFSGVMDTAIAIRTMTVHKGAVYCQGGAGVVFDSNPTSEYEETVSKLMGVVRAVALASEMTAASSSRKVRGSKRVAEKSAA